ncbi:hypothetical protein EYF80_009825 [Liparis tanakae]|uniref:Uncharacterized protein n=1 Tax=Liparis tanakae TaxID=230148 RepID=A0A4Z2IQE5_9TELE|nr:hypothetical protein EYF80_009825 [Liparis tanakae]
MRYFENEVVEAEDWETGKSDRDIVERKRGVEEWEGEKEDKTEREKEHAAGNTGGILLYARAALSWYEYKMRVAKSRLYFLTWRKDRNYGNKTKDKRT